MKLHRSAKLLDPNCMCERTLSYHAPRLFATVKSFVVAAQSCFQKWSKIAAGVYFYLHSRFKTKFLRVKEQSDVQQESLFFAEKKYLDFSSKKLFLALTIYLGAESGVWIQNMDPWMSSRVYYHCATPFRIPTEHHLLSFYHLIKGQTF